VGNRSKRTSLPLAVACTWQGPLAPRALPRFIATMNPADSRPGPDRRLCFPARRWTEVLPVGSPRFPTGLSARATPNHPGERDRCLCPLLPCRWQASPPSGGLAALNSLTRPNRVQLLAARTFALRGFAPRITPTHARSATCRMGNLHDKLLSACETCQASPGAPEATEGHSRQQTLCFRLFLKIARFSMAGSGQLRGEQLQ
jgi:hypothetical protein